METAAPATAKRSRFLTVLVSVERKRKCISGSLQPSSVIQLRRHVRKCGTLLNVVTAVHQFWLTVLRDLLSSHSEKSIFESSTLAELFCSLPPEPKLFFITSIMASL